jgi:predicted amidohydrolase YtcJ
MKIDRDTPNPTDGVICEDENGKPTGILKDIQNDSFLNTWFIGRPISCKGNRKNYLGAIKKCSEYGITSVQDNTTSFGVYCFHAPILVGVTMLMRTLFPFPLAKALLAALVAWILSVGTAWLVRRIPGVGRLFQ